MTGFINGPYTARNNGYYWEVADKDGDQVGDACAACVEGYDDKGEIAKDWPKGEAVARLFAAAPRVA